MTDRGQTLPVIAEVADGAAYDRRWTLLTAENPNYQRYRARTARALPITCATTAHRNQPREACKECLYA